MSSTPPPDSVNSGFDSGSEPDFEGADEPGSNAIRVDSFTDVMRRAIRRSVVFAVLALVVLSTLGFLVSGSSGLWGAAIGGGLGIFFCLITAFATLLTRKQTAVVFGGVIMGSWAAKMVVLVVVLLILRGLEFYDRVWLLISVIIVALGLPIIEAITVKKSRMTYLDTDK